MHVEDTLTSGVFVGLHHRHAIGMQRVVDHARHQRRRDHQCPGTRRSDIEQSACVQTRYEKRVPLRYGLSVKKRNRVRILIEEVRGLRTADDTTKGARRVVTHLAKYCSQFQRNSKRRALCIGLARIAGARTDEVAGSPTTVNRTVRLAPGNTAPAAPGGQTHQLEPLYLNLFHRTVHVLVG